VIIDTDGGIDDIRANKPFFSLRRTSGSGDDHFIGALSAENAYLKVKSLLNSCFHEGLPVGINRKTGFRSPDYTVALQTKWGEENRHNFR